MISWFEKNYKFSAIISIVIAIAMFYISSLSLGGVGGEKGNNLLAISYHIISFFFLALFLGFALVRRDKMPFFIVVILISTVYALTDEIHQYFVPGRNASLLDVGFDFIGILFASLIYFISIEFRKKITKSL